MAFLNGKYTSFDPNIETSETFYSTISQFPYTKEFRVKGDYGNSYNYMPELKHLIYDGEKSRIFRFGGEGGASLEKISFVNGSLAYWNENNRLWFNLADIRAVMLKEVNFESVDSRWRFDTYSEFQYLNWVENISVFNGWKFDLVCLSEHLSVNSIIGIINNLATLEEGEEHSIQFANISDVPDEYIQVAINKGWAVE